MNRDEELGRIVRKVWIKWCVEQGITEPHKVCPYDEMPEEVKDVDNRIGVAVADHATETLRRKVEKLEEILENRGHRMDAFIMVLEIIGNRGREDLPEYARGILRMSAKQLIEESKEQKALAEQGRRERKARGGRSGE